MRALFFSVSDTAPVPDGELFCCTLTAAPSLNSGCCPVTITNLIFAGPTGGRVYDPDVAVQVFVGGVPCGAFAPTPNATGPQPPMQTPTPTPTAIANPGRFVDNGDGTVTDTQTRLMWEKKTGTVGGSRDFNDPENVNNSYTWCIGTFYALELDVIICTNSSSPPDGTAFTDFLPRVNGTLCSGSSCPALGGHSDWRLPTSAELQTIIDGSASGCGWGCLPGPCVDPTFGPTQSNFYWSSTTYQVVPNAAWGVICGIVEADCKSYNGYVRAVRSGS